MLKEVCICLLHHNFQGLVLVAAAVVVEVKVQNFNFVFQVTLVDLAQVLGGDSHFAVACYHAQQVDDVHRAIGVHNILKVDSKCLFIQCGRPCQSHIFFQTFLFPEHWNRTSDLNMTHEELAGDNHDLFGFALIANVARIVDATRIVSSAGSVVNSARHEGNRHVYVVDFAVCLREVSLNQGREPSAVNLLVDEVAVKRQVPKVLVVTGDKLQRICVLGLHPLKSALSGARQVVAVRKVKAIFKQVLDVNQHVC